MIQQPLRQLVTPAELFLQDALGSGRVSGHEVDLRQDSQGIWIGRIGLECGFYPGARAIRGSVVQLRPGHNRGECLPFQSGPVELFQLRGHTLIWRCQKECLGD